jgi:RNA recognition motif-containing protein
MSMMFVMSRSDAQAQLVYELNQEEEEFFESRNLVTRIHMSSEHNFVLGNQQQKTAWADEVDEEDSAAADLVGALHGRKTLMLSNLDYKLKLEDIQRLLEDAGLGDSYDVLHLPLFMGKRRNLGYLFINFICFKDAIRCVELLHQQPFGGKRCIVKVAACQGLMQSDKRLAGKACSTWFRPK